MHTVYLCPADEENGRVLNQSCLLLIDVTNRPFLKRCSNQFQIAYRAVDDAQRCVYLEIAALVLIERFGQFAYQKLRERVSRAVLHLSRLDVVVLSKKAVGITAIGGIQQFNSLHTWALLVGSPTRTSRVLGKPYRTTPVSGCTSIESTDLPE